MMTYYKAKSRRDHQTQQEFLRCLNSKAKLPHVDETDSSGDDDGPTIDKASSRVHPLTSRVLLQAASTDPGGDRF
jgi:hypothetical protein